MSLLYIPYKEFVKNYQLISYIFVINNDNDGIHFYIPGYIYHFWKRYAKSAYFYANLTGHQENI